MNEEKEREKIFSLSFSFSFSFVNYKRKKKMPVVQGNSLIKKYYNQSGNIGTIVDMYPDTKDEGNKAQSPSNISSIRVSKPVWTGSYETVRWPNGCDTGI